MRVTDTAAAAALPLHAFVHGALAVLMLLPHLPAVLPRPHTRMTLLMWPAVLLCLLLMALSCSAGARAHSFDAADDALALTCCAC